MSAMDPILRNFRQMARYNTRANHTLYAACAILTDEARKQDRGAFFRSIHNTLNHILLGDRVWFGRFRGEAVALAPLDTVLHDDFADLRAARVDEDTRIEAFVGGLKATDIDRPLEYVSLAGDPVSDPMSLILPHVFNHQTHHRGQVHDMLSQAGVATPISDMHRILRPTFDDPVDMV